MTSSGPTTRRIARFAVHTVAWMVLLVTVGVLAVTVLVPRAVGGTPYTIETGSMRPGMPPGTLVVVRPVDPADVGIGTVVTYQLDSGEPTVVTHRVVATSIDARGRLWFQTQGDANPAPDARWVRPVQLRGERWYSVPELGRINLLISGRQHQLLTYIGAGLLGLWALQLFAGAHRERNERRRRDAAAAAPAAVDHSEEMTHV